MAHPAMSIAFPPTPDRSQTATPTETTSKPSQSGLKDDGDGDGGGDADCSTGRPLRASKLKISLTTQPRPVPRPNSAEIWSLKCHTDHMLTCEWTAEAGWGSPKIQPFGPLSLSPLSSALHYATECFEGMKVYRGHDGRLRLFRPERNCERMLRSATRVALPGFDPRELRRLIEALVAIDGPRWLPDRGIRHHHPDPQNVDANVVGRGGGGGVDHVAEQGWRGAHLYLRPTLVGTGNTLGVHKPTEALLFLVAMCFPSLDEPHKAPKPASLSVPQTLSSIPGASLALTTTRGDDHIKKNNNDDNNNINDNDNNDKKTAQIAPGMRLLASCHDMIRAWPGGFGNAKVGANYGPSLVAQQEARERGYDQILWLFGDQCYVTEAGASNFFLVWKTRDVEQGGGGGSTTMTTTTTAPAGRGGRLQLVTAPLGDGVILEGVTRASVLDLARERWSAKRGTVSATATTTTTTDEMGHGDGEGEMEMEMEVVERKYTMGEVVEAAEEGRLVEAFACGTAYFVAPVGEIHFRGRDVRLPFKSGVQPTYTMTIKKWLREIMFGVVDHEWGAVIDEST